MHRHCGKIFAEQQTPEMSPKDKEFIRWKVEMGMSQSTEA